MPTILCELDGNSLKNSYFYADGQILKQNNYGASYSYYYIHDRLGSIRQVIRSDGLGNYGFVVNSYTYNPFGEMIATECTESGFYNPFKFTGQWFDAEIGQYYLRARMYDPQLMRFTARDPVRGKFEEPLTLHKYLYCENEPINRIDPTGRSAWSLVGEVVAGSAVYSASIYTVATGIQTNNDRLFDIGLRMQYFVPRAMAFGAITGPLLPCLPGVLARASLALWEGVVGAAGYAGGAVGAGAEALSYWAMLNPYEFISTMDVLGQIGGPPDSVPMTPAGWVTWLYVNSRDN